MRASEKLKLHYKEIMALKTKHKLQDLAIFGSVARGEDTEKSDVDFIVIPDPENIYSLYDFCADVEEVLGFKCNVLSTQEGEDLTSPVYVNALRDRAEIIEFSGEATILNKRTGKFY